MNKIVNSEKFLLKFEMVKTQQEVKRKNTTIILQHDQIQ